MEKMLILGVDSSTLLTLEACKTRGIYTIITDYMTPQQNPVKTLSDEYWMVNCTDLDKLEEKCHKENITSVFAGNHETCVECTKELAKRLNFPFYASDYSWEVSRDKTLFKKLCAENDIQTAKVYDMEYGINPEVMKTVEYPVVIKPVDASSMRGFSIVHDESEFYKAYERAMSYSESHRVIVEEFLTGMEFQLNCIAQDGELTCFSYLNIHKFDFNGKWVMVSGMPFDPAKDPCFTDEFMDRLLEMTRKMDVRNGEFFYQGFRHKGKPYLTEFAARLDGGGIWSIYKRLFGYDIVGYMVDLARGADPEHNFTKVSYDLNGKYYAEYGIWARSGIVEKVIGDDFLEADPRIKVILRRLYPGVEIKDTGDMTQIGWYVNFIADSREELFEIFERINANVKVISTEGENLVCYYSNYTEIQM